MPKFEIEIVRSYFVNDVIEVEAKNLNEAYSLALVKANNTDYTGRLEYDDTEIVGNRTMR